MMKKFVVVLLLGLGVLSCEASTKIDDVYAVCTQVDLLPEHIEVIKSFVDEARVLGYSDEQIVQKFAQAAGALEENNGVLKFSLDYDKKTVYWTIGILSVVTASALLTYIIYRYVKNKNNQIVNNNGNNQVNQPGQQPAGDPNANNDNQQQLDPVQQPDPNANGGQAANQQQPDPNANGGQAAVNQPVVDPVVNGGQNGANNNGGAAPIAQPVKRNRRQRVGNSSISNANILPVGAKRTKTPVKR